jgi:DNA-binding transcriptional MerR regulator
MLVLTGRSTPWLTANPLKYARSQVSERSLTIGQLARRAGVATSALRYWEQRGLLPAPGRISGQRRYPESAVTLIGVILLLSDAGFSLEEQKAFAITAGVAVAERRQLAQRKLAELDAQIVKAQAAREAVEHALRCPHEDILQCPTFGSLVTARLAGQPLHKAHVHQPRPTATR